MEKTKGRNVKVFGEDFNLYVLGLAYILAGCERRGHVLSYCFLMKKSLYFKSDTVKKIETTLFYQCFYITDLIF